VSPGDGAVFLAGRDGQVARHDGTTCINEMTNGSNSPITGIIGFTSGSPTSVYLATESGRLFTWTPGSNPQPVFNMFPESYAGIHGQEPSLLLGVGGEDDGTEAPTANSFSSTGSNFLRHSLQTPSDYSFRLRAVWMGGPRLAYAVGDSGLVMKWNGTTIWTTVPPPLDNPIANFTSVVVLDPSSIYTTDASGAIRRLTSTGWVSPAVFTSDQPLRDLAATSPGNLWAVGDNGRVVHFPE
jgi:hypothetical protein